MWEEQRRCIIERWDDWQLTRLQGREMNVKIGCVQLVVEAKLAAC